MAHRPLSDYHDILGKTLIDKLTCAGKPELAPLRIGTDVFSPIDFARKVGATNLGCARKLTRLADEIGAKNVPDFYKKSTPYSFATSEEVNAGLHTMMVAILVFEVFGLNAKAWYKRGEQAQAEAQGLDFEKDITVGFMTFKKREAKYRARASKAERLHRAHPGNAKPSTAHDRKR